MTRIVLYICIVLTLFCIVIPISSCTVFSALVGKWQFSNSKDNIEFTRDGGYFGRSEPPIPV